MIENKRQIPSLTGLRGYAALWVVGLHFTFGAERPGKGFLYDIAWHGSAGVIVFFVLSGFILSHVYYHAFKEKVTWLDYGHFLLYRLVRIYPLYAITLVAWLLIFHLGGYLWRVQDTLSTFLLNATMMQAWGFVDGLTWNDPAWSVSMEWFFYLSFPLFALLVLRLDWRPLLAIVCACVGAVWALPLIIFKASIVLPGEFSSGAALALNAGAFMAGAALYPLIRQASAQRWWSHAGNIAVLAGTAVFLYLCTVTFVERWLATVASVLIVAGGYQSGIGQAIFGNRPVVYLRKISYSIYLTHIMVLVVLRRELPTAPFLLWVAIALVLAAAVHHGAEEPLRRWGRSLWPIAPSEPLATSCEALATAPSPGLIRDVGCSLYEAPSRPN
jgi:peptidoglycan/LPS O-acetylase OafA/YrhL